MVTLLYFARAYRSGEGEGFLYLPMGVSRNYVPVLERDCLSKTSVADPNPDPYPPDPHVFGPPLDPDPDPLFRGMDPDPSITRQK
jgi:hypothetical protein